MKDQYGNDVVKYVFYSPDYWNIKKYATETSLGFCVKFKNGFSINKMIRFSVELHEIFTKEKIPNKCGNGICEASETKENCEVDCFSLDCSVVASKLSKNTIENRDFNAMKKENSTINNINDTLIVIIIILSAIILLIFIYFIKNCYQKNVNSRKKNMRKVSKNYNKSNVPNLNDIKHTTEEKLEINRINQKIKIL